MSKRKTLRRLLSSDDIVVAPGAYDGLTAHFVEAAGFPAAYMTGAGVSASFGLPDYGLLTATEMRARAELIAGVTDIPLIADADTGYGNELNVTRTVRDYEQAGVAALHIEDQVSPKRCGHLTGKEVVPTADFIAKIRAAVAARRDSDLLIIARTDSRAVLGFDEAISRANAALDAGADLIFVEATRSVGEAAAVPKRVKGPCLLNMVAGGVTPVENTIDAQKMGYRAAIVPFAILPALMERAQQALKVLKQEGHHSTLRPGTGPESIFRKLGSARWDDLRTQFEADIDPAQEGGRGGSVA